MIYYNLFINNNHQDNIEASVYMLKKEEGNCDYN